VSTTPASVVYAAAKTNLFQSPPYERPGGDEVLILRCYQDDEPTEVWRLPIVGELDCPAELVPWTDGTFLARVDAKFTPPDLPSCDFDWMLRAFAVTCNGSCFHPNVLPALRRFDGSILDQILARIEARADSNSTGDIQMGTATASRSDFAAAQIKANRVANAYGDSAPPPLAGESLLDYRARLASVYKKFSRSFKDSDLHKIGDPSAMSGIEDAIYNDAMAEARHPTAASLKPGQLRAVGTQDASGRTITKYYGDIAAFMDQFNPPHRYITRFMTNGR
jgi:hypothetical protein